MGQGDGAGAWPRGAVQRSAGFEPTELSEIYGGALALTLATALAFAGVFVLRLGFGDSLAQVGRLFVLAIFPIWATSWAMSAFSRNGLGAACAAGTAFILANLWPILGFPFGTVATVAAAALVLFAIGFGAKHLLGAMREAKMALAVAVLLSALLLVTSTLPSRLILPESLITGLVPSDNYFDTSVAQMVAHYHRFSIGGDGLDFFHYHFLSHVVAAGAAMSSGVDVPHVYLYWGALTLKVQLLWSLTFASTFLFRAEPLGKPSGLLWRLIYFWLVLLLIDNFESESFMLGLAFIIASLPLLLLLPAEGGSLAAILFAAILAIAAVFVAAAAKVSAGYFGAIGLFVLLWHLRKRRLPAVLLALGLVALAASSYMWLVPAGAASPGFILMAVSYFQYLTWQTLASYILPLLVLALYIWRPRPTLREEDGAVQFGVTAMRRAPRSSAGGFGSLRVGWDWLAGTDVISQFLFLALAGCVFVLFTVPIGSNMAYFSLFLYAFALLLLPAALEAGSAIHLANRWFKWALGLAMFASAMSFLIAFLSGFAVDLTQLQRAASGMPAEGSSGLKNNIMASLKATHTPFANLRNTLSDVPLARLDRDLLHDNDIAGGRLAVHIDISANNVWRLLEGKSPYWCMAPQLLVPSTTGIVELRSYAPKAIEAECSPTGLNFYAPADIALRRSASIPDEELCRLGAPLGIHRVYILHSVADLSKNRLIDCGS
jgi:hypothetical protein